jgi:hypothetical protein
MGKLKSGWNIRRNWLQNAATLVAGATVFVAAGCSASGPLATGSLAITVIGPPGAPAVIEVSGPFGFHQTIAATTTLSNLLPGYYTIDAMSVVVANVRYGAARTIEPVVASSMPSGASVTYRSIPALKIVSDAPPPGTVGLVYGIGTPVEDECKNHSPNCFPCASVAACAGLPACHFGGTSTRPTVFNPPCVSILGGAVVFSGTGGMPSYGWSARSLPPGLSVDRFLGLIFGVPTKAGTYTTAITVTDSDSPPVSTTVIYQIVIAP